MKKQIIGWMGLSVIGIIGLCTVVYALTTYETEKIAERQSVYISDGKVIHEIKRYNKYTKDEVSPVLTVITSAIIDEQIAEKQDDIAELKALKVDVLVEEAKL
jgi:UV DNA damage repair endonuclease